MCATSDKIGGSESKEDSDREDAMLCFVAFEEDSKEGDETTIENDNSSYHELLCVFEEMENLLKKINILKNERSSLTNFNKSSIIKIKS